MPSASRPGGLRRVQSHHISPVLYKPICSGKLWPQAKLAVKAEGGHAPWSIAGPNALSEAAGGSFQEQINVQRENIYGSNWLEYSTQPTDCYWTSQLVGGGGVYHPNMVDTSSSTRAASGGLIAGGIQGIGHALQEELLAAHSTVSADPNGNSQTAGITWEEHYQQMRSLDYSSPGDADSSPGEPGSSPGETGSSSDDAGSSPGDTDSSPGDTGSSPGDTGSCSSAEGSLMQESLATVSSTSSTITANSSYNRVWSVQKILSFTPEPVSSDARCRVFPWSMSCRQREHSVLAPQHTQSDIQQQGECSGYHVMAGSSQQFMQANQQSQPTDGQQQVPTQAPHGYYSGIDEVDSCCPMLSNPQLPSFMEPSITPVQPHSPACPLDYTSLHPRKNYRSGFKFSNHFINRNASYSCPMPQLTWGDPDDVFGAMKKKDLSHYRDAHWLNRHPDLNANVRSIILHWLLEVCDAYKMHRMTFHLAVDFFDRCMGKLINISRGQIQMIGVTALFSASKVEEIYPPKAADFADMTDGLCTEKDIINQEMILLKTLGWELNPLTANSFLELYMQLIFHKLRNPISCEEASLQDPLFTGQKFVELARLVELCLLDAGSLQFSYGMLAAAVVYYFTDEYRACEVSGFTFAQLLPCIRWALPFHMAVQSMGPVDLKTFENVPSADYHTIQTLEVNLALLEVAQVKAKELDRIQPQSSPALPDSLLTPPTKPSVLRS